MGYPVRYADKLRFSSDINDYRLMQTCLTEIYLKDEESFGPPYAERASAIVSVIKHNRNLHGDAFNALEEDFHIWSMVETSHHLWRNLQPMFAGDVCTGFMVDDVMIIIPVHSYYIEGNDVLN